MTQFILDHPVVPNVQASYGVDPHIGLFVSIQLDGAVIDEYHHPPCGNEVADALEVLKNNRFFGTDEVSNALESMKYLVYDDIKDQSFASCALVVERLSTAS